MKLCVFGIPKKIRIVPWGVNLNDYHPVESSVKEKAFIFVGALKERKGVEYLINAFAQLAYEYNDVKLYFVANPSDKYVRLIDKLNINQKVIFTGKVSHSELLNYYSKSICHILPSMNTKYAFEGFGLVHLEANACGVPSIGSLGTANEEIIQDGYNGFLCPQGDINTLYARMKFILKSPETHLKLCRNALKQAKNFTWDIAASAILNSIE
jgi:glycosyltransferase involved in cell wall biosynthesis